MTKETIIAASQGIRFEITAVLRAVDLEGGMKRLRLRAEDYWLHQTVLSLNALATKAERLVGQKVTVSGYIETPQGARTIMEAAEGAYVAEKIQASDDKRAYVDYLFVVGRLTDRTDQGYIMEVPARHGTARFDLVKEAMGLTLTNRLFDVRRNGLVEIARGRFVEHRGFGTHDSSGIVATTIAAGRSWDERAA